MSSDATESSRPRESLKVLFDHELTNAPGKSIIGVEVAYPPNGFTPPHRHAGATVVALVQDGQLLSGMNGNPPKVYLPGESFVELPGCHHTVGENNSKEESAKLLAIFVVDTSVVKTQGYAGLSVFD
ncbi:RmlC-like jelly roll fold protein [Pochonia chlamydosporia 170]|uniref:RmlC-like jelly roll fold protein n=1 Tax=Pochonia chlamydosporia 170 TaxID=1380566 RepID=A0A179F087_METCM|nr:RmlC-like jelly roll fold protein [Pochonia chlamydosporia 170]OAQ58513.1 RmlC-like jelly roll fold protein [Pochonia chlamydosporia 170]